MFHFFDKARKEPKDENQILLESLFRFLLDDYGFQFKKIDLGNAVDENGKLIFYGPFYAYCFFNKCVCINVMYLVQRQEYDIYITDSCKDDQVYMRSGTPVPYSLADYLTEFVLNIKNSIMSSGEIYGHKISQKSR